MTIHNQNQYSLIVNHQSLHMNDSTLSETQQFKYLGVLLDQKVSWIQHISYVKNKISKGMGIKHEGTWDQKA